jgi:hypothetical protein
MKVRFHPVLRILWVLLAGGFLYVAVDGRAYGGLLLAAPFTIASLQSLRPRVSFDGRTMTVRSLMAGGASHTASPGDRFFVTGSKAGVRCADGRHLVLVDLDNPTQRLDRPHPGDWRRFVRAVATGRIGDQDAPAA